MSETRLVPLSKIRDNPWRDRVRNPIDPERVEAIGTSISKTSKYWLGTYGREVKGDFIELAFGHHRYEAAKAQGLTEIPITIEPFTDGEMLVWMAQENVRGELPVVIEAVSAAVRALGEGKIQIEAPDSKTNLNAIRYAPSFIAGKASVTTVVTHHPMSPLAHTRCRLNPLSRMCISSLAFAISCSIKRILSGTPASPRAFAISMSFNRWCHTSSFAWIS